MRTHPDWCSIGHRCGLGEHRSDPIVTDIPAAGRVVLTRVNNGGRHWVEVIVRLELADVEPRARWQLATLLRLLGVAMSRAARASRWLWRD